MDLRTVAEWCGGRVVWGDPGALVSEVVTDTRGLGTGSAGALFVALVGERFDGHDFLEMAREGGGGGSLGLSGAGWVLGRRG